MSSDTAGSAAPRLRIVCVGIGNALRGDDAAGLLAAAAVRAAGLPGVTVVESAGDGAALLDLFADADAVYLLDAAQAGGPPGTIHRVDALAQPLPRGLFAASSHLFGAAEAVEMARALGQLPPYLVVYGVEAADFALGAPPSEAVAAAAHEAAQRVIGEIISLIPQPSRCAETTSSLPRDRGQVNQAARLRLTVRGAVQGVGFRPFVYRLARELALAGWVNNAAQGVLIEVEGPPAALEAFRARLESDAPPRAIVQSVETARLAPVGYTAFEIRSSESGGARTTLVLPDIATCPDCLAEIFDPSNRRYRYPFTNCTNCGPRYSIIEALPYDRPNTTMRHFPMCPACRAEYENPLDRRFHAQPNACPVCGPRLALWGPDGSEQACDDDALRLAADALRAGLIVAVKGLGGFHLMVDARNETAVRRLRARKRREAKPFALMYPSLDAIRADCDVSHLEAALLTAPEAPITLLRRRAGARGVAEAVAPGNPYLGTMLPYTPLHHLLMVDLGFPVVATSGNLSDEPICTDEREALERLAGIADLFLVHNRPIARHADDSIVRLMAGRELVLRRARGYAPLPVRAPFDLPPALAVGAHLKNTVAVAVGRDIFTSQHIGDLETAQAFDAFTRTAASLQALYELEPRVIACDLHPDYLSTQHAARAGLPLVRVQHHYAHVLACMAEHSVAPPALGIAWDGTGYGPDGTVWGGEFLRVTESGWERAAHLLPFRLLGGDAAAREPRRSALGALFAVYGAGVFERDDLPPLAAFSSQERAVLQTMLERGLNAPLTSSAGRLFDAVAALLGLAQRSAYEGEAAMMLEFAAEGFATDEPYPFTLDADGVLDWRQMIRYIDDERHKNVPAGFQAARFHTTLVEMMVAVARQAGQQRVILTGGCFQNRRLAEQAVTRLRAAGFEPVWHQRIPPNDGGIALGQLMAAALALRGGAPQVPASSRE
ncbi:MAG: carbamoyltransferase HypF [Aggregatilineales bacterium]